ncbi:MAG: DNA primase [Desulfarculaceae bacterium]|nr:DNA primase [Desulfarculaceae bacterium]
MFIPEQKITEILNSADIVEIIGESVILKKSGSNYTGLCPFHTEKTPSFSVSPSKQIFHCFGCKAGGDVFAFLMKHYGLSFPEAVKMVAGRYNIVVETGALSEEKKRQLDLKEGLFRLNRKVMAYYRELLSDADTGKGARAYLESRQTSKEIIEKFQLGFAPDRWDTVVNYFRKMKVKKSLAENSGLVMPRKSGTGYYDRFRNRLVFPIFDINMQVAGFGGRILDDGMPKYLNSPETPVYNKRRILYGLHESRPYIRQSGRVYIVEGYFDFLSLFQHGIRNAAATLGTALTKEHVRILKGFTSQAVLVFDSDEAGINAAKKSIDLFVNEGVAVKILVLPDGKDPDSFVMEQGAEVFEKEAENALSAVDFLTRVAVKKYGTSIEGRIRVLEEVVPFLASMEDYALRSLHIREIAENLDIDENAVMEKVKEGFRTDRKKGNLSVETAETEKSLDSDRRESQVLSMMIRYPGLRDEIRQRGVLDCFYSEKLKAIGEKVLATDPDDDHFMNRLMTSAETQEERETMAGLAMTDTFETDGVGEKAVALMNRIVKIRKKRENRLTKQIKQAEKNCDTDPFELLAQKQEEIRRLHENK